MAEISIGVRGESPNKQFMWFSIAEYVLLLLLLDTCNGLNTLPSELQKF